MLCGVLCGEVADPVGFWVEQLLPAAEGNGAADREDRSALREVGEAVEKQVRGPDLTLDLPVPEEGAPLVERVTAVYDWVRGFLYAMGILGISERDLAGEAQEAYRDFAELTRLDLDRLEEGEENEQALMEITEFVRVAAMTIYEACAQIPQRKKKDA